MSRRRSDPRRIEQDLKRLKRENDRLRKMVRRSFEGDAPEPVVEEVATVTIVLDGPRCDKCGAQTELLDLEIRRYYQCTKERTHRQRA